MWDVILWVAVPAWMQLPGCVNLVNINSVFYDNLEQTLFYTMPFFHGHPEFGLELEEWKHTYRFTESDLLYIGASICNAMKECCKRTGKIPVHGDIKPSNVFLEYKEERFAHAPVLNCNVRLADCGIFGYTAAYFPMEYKKDGLPQDTASDVYAWITVMNELENYVSPDYDRDNSIIHLLYELLIEQGQWKIYDLPGQRYGKDLHGACLCHERGNGACHPALCGSCRYAEI